MNRILTEKHLMVCEDCTPAAQVVETEEKAALKCVRCPFCQQTVSAILTEDTISCPSCNVSVKR